MGPSSPGSRVSIPSSAAAKNRVVGAKMSEHGRANALDIRAIRLKSGQVVRPTDPGVSEDFRSAMRTSVCARFTTVLGPGSDGYHEDHIHVDLAERHSGYRICQWDFATLRPKSATPCDPRPALSLSRDRGLQRRADAAHKHTKCTPRSPSAGGRGTPAPVRPICASPSPRHREGRSPLRIARASQRPC